VIAMLVGCSSDDDGITETCGPSGAPTIGMTMQVGTEIVTYGGFAASENNDCTIPSSGVISVSVHGMQNGGDQPFTLCLPRPDLLGPMEVPLVPSRVPPMETDRAMLIDTGAALSDGCIISKDITQLPTATVRFLGYCDGGAHPDGYAVEVSGNVPLIKNCNAVETQVTGILGGRVAVEVTPPP
jgi:hypothetical protein